MNVNEIMGFLGRFTIIGGWFIIMGVSLWRSIKRKQKLWITFLIMNFILGALLPTLIVAILPIIYLIKNREIKLHKPQPTN